MECFPNHYVHSARYRHRLSKPQVLTYSIFRVRRRRAYAQVVPGGCRV